MRETGSQIVFYACVGRGQLASPKDRVGRANHRVHRPCYRAVRGHVVACEAGVDFRRNDRGVEPLGQGEDRLDDVRLVDVTLARDHCSHHGVGGAVHVPVLLVGLDVGVTPGQQVEELGEDLELAHLPGEEHGHQCNPEGEGVTLPREGAREAFGGGHGVLRSAASAEDAVFAPGPRTTSKCLPPSRRATIKPRGPTR